jgi:hypothetical protein
VTVEGQCLPRQGACANCHSERSGKTLDLAIDRPLPPPIRIVRDVLPSTLKLIVVANDVVVETDMTELAIDRGPSILSDRTVIRVGGNGTTWLGESRGCSFGYRWRSRWLTFLGVMALLTVPFDALGQSTPVTSGMSNLTATTVEFFIDPNSNARMQADKWRES